MNFDLETSKKILKIIGILTIIGAVLSLIGGILMMAGGGAATGMEEAATDTDLQNGIAAMIGVGIVIVISGIINLISGIVSVKASKDGKYGKIAWIFAILGIIGALINGVSNLTSSFSFSTLLSTLISLALSAMIFFAAKTVKTAHEAGQF